MSTESELQEVMRMLKRERLLIDEFADGKTTFLTHVGSVATLQPGPWMAHRELVLSLALANLTPAQRASLARAARAEHGREFGVGRLALETRTSGVPLGGSLVSLQTRGGGLRALVCWAIGTQAEPTQTDWLVVRAQPEWALEPPPRDLTSKGIETLVGLGGSVVIAVPSASAARQVADELRPRVPHTAHPRFAPHLESPEPQADVCIWPHDGYDSQLLAQRAINTLVLVGANEAAQRDWERVTDERDKCELVTAACPGRVDRGGLERFWSACGKPKILLRGDPIWVDRGEQFLSDLGATVVARGSGRQLGLFG